MRNVHPRNPDRVKRRMFTKLALRTQRTATTLYDITAQGLLFDSDDKHTRMTAFLERRTR